MLNRCSCFRIVVILALFLLFSTRSYGVYYSTNGIMYDLYNGHKADVMGTAGKGTSDIVIPKTVEYKGETYTVIRISGFQNNTSITSIVIPEGVAISYGAFAGCSNLTSVVLPASIKGISGELFKDCSSLCNIIIPDSVAYIQDKAFYGCTNLKNVEIKSEMLCTIGASAFQGCEFLETITIPSSVKTIGVSAFQGCKKLEKITIPSSVATIGSSAFWGCNNLSSVIVSDGVAEIGEKAFYNCQGLKQIQLPHTISKFSAYLFYGCSSLSKIAIPESIVSIDNYSFAGCSSLSVISLPKSVRTIGNAVFKGCANLNSAEMPDTLESISSYAFQDCASLTDIKLPQELKTIGSYCFSGCTNLEKIDLPQQLETIGSRAFNDCQNLKSIIIPNSVTNIGAYCLSGCTALEEISIPFVGIERNPKGSTQNTLFGCIFSDTSRPGHTEVNQKYMITSTSWSGKVSYIPSGLSKVVVTGNSNLFFAFHNCSMIKDVEISGCLTAIGESSFENCTNLERVTLSNTILGIGKNAFYGCEKLDSITIPQYVNSISSGAFNGCPLNYVKIESPNITLYNIGTQVANCVIGGNVTTIKRQYFLNCRNLSSVTIEEGCSRVEHEAFYNTTISRLYLPKSISFFGVKYSSSIHGLSYRGMEEDWNNIENYSEMSPCVFHYGIIIPGEEFNKDGIYYCANDTMPATVSVISGAAPYSGKIYIPRCVTMEGRTFKITHFSNNAFYGCDNIDTIYYSGNIIEWQKLHFGNNIDVLTKIPVVYNYNEDSVDSIVENRLYISDLRVKRGSPIQLDINMKNTKPMTGFQFEIELPEGFDICKDKDNVYKCCLSTGRTSADKHDIFEISRLKNGCYFLLCSSSTNEIFSGDDGCVISIEIDTEDNLLDGVYSIALRNISISDEASNVTRLRESLSNLTLFSYTLGDVNCDEDINIGDISCIANIILGFTNENYCLEAADVNRDNDTNVGDIACTAEYILNGSFGLTNSLRIRGVDDNYRGPIVSMPDMMFKQGESCKAMINLTSEGGITALQFDIELPEGLKLLQDDDCVGFVNKSIHGHELAWARVGCNRTRIISYSVNNEAYDNGKVDLISLEIMADAGIPAGTYCIVLRNIVLATRNTTIKLDDRVVKVNVGQATSIIKIGDSHIPSQIFNLHGVVNEKITQGINIINKKKYLFK